jgi:FkbM family methyltransferase
MGTGGATGTVNTGRRIGKGSNEIRHTFSRPFMIQEIKDSLSATLFKCGLDLRRASRTPFGVRWYRDIQYFPNGVALDTVFDIGANTGQTAQQLVRHFPKARIYSFEPVPSTFQELVRNTSNYGNVEPVCCALGAARGSGKMTTESLSVGNTLVVNEELGSSSGALVEVPVDTVDAFCADRNLQRVNLLKIDTEGYEMSVLRGAQNLLAEKRIDFILAECDFSRREGEPHGDFIEISQHVSAFGFRVVSFYAGGVDDLGWVWGDVLFREISGSQPGRIACSPVIRSLDSGKQVIHR